MELDDILATMISDVKSGKFKKSKKPKKKGVATPRTPAQLAAFNPWTDEALVLMAVNTICNSCGNEAMSWNDTLYIERVNNRRASPITLIEELKCNAYSTVYGSLPKRIEMRIEHSPACPQCFGIGDNRADDLTGKMAPVQLAIEFPSLKKLKTGEIL